MAASTIKVSTEQMEQTVSHYESSKGRQEAALNKMKSAVDGLQGTWKGGASSAFQSAFSALYTNLKTSDVHMQDAIEELKTSANLFKNLEEENLASGFRGLDAGNPFQA